MYESRVPTDMKGALGLHNLGGTSSRDYFVFTVFMTAPVDVSRSPKLLYHLSTQKPSRPPIHNPYDKFTQSEFDAWIGGITGALRHALGQVEDAEQIPEPHSPHSDASSDEGKSVAAQLLQDDSSADEEFEDSFADIKARKGKARDPRDGPGIRGGDRSQPIEIDSDSEDEGQIQQEESEEDERSDEWDEESGEEEEEEEEEHPPWQNGESSAQARIRHERERLEPDVYEEDDYEHEAEEDYEEEEEHSGEYEEEYENHDPSGGFAETKDIIVFSDNQENGEEGEEFLVHELVDEDEPDGLDKEGQEESGSIQIPGGVTSSAYPRLPIRQPDVAPQDIDDEVEELHPSPSSDYEYCPPVEAEEVEHSTQEIPPIHTFEGSLSQGVGVEEGDEIRPTNTLEDEQRLSGKTVNAEEVDPTAQVLEPEVAQPSHYETCE